MATVLQEFKIFLIVHDLSIDPSYRLCVLCPQILKDYTFDEIIMTVPFLARDLKPTSKTIIVPPIIYNSMILDAMKNRNAIMAHISGVMAAKGETIIRRELLHQFRLAHAKLTL